MKQMIMTLTVFLVALVCFETNVKADTIEREGEVIFSNTYGNGSYMFPAAFNYGLTSVKYAKIVVEANAGANYKVILLHNSGGGGYDVNEQASSTMSDINKSQKQIIYFMPQSRNCPSDYTVCVKVSSSMPGTSSSYIGVTANQTGIKFQKTSVLGTLSAKADVTYYMI